MTLLNFPVGAVILWENTAIPSGWQVCDGTNGTPNMIGRLVYGASVDGDVGVTGGLSTHTHTSPVTGTRAAHNHGGSVSGSVNGNRSQKNTVPTSSPGNAASVDHSHSVSVSISPADSHTHTTGVTGSAGSFPRNITRVFIMRIS